MLRKIVHIDEDKCNGCGLCIPNCAEGAIQIIDGKAKLLSDNLCDGLGACLGNCPVDAIKVIEREGDAFDEEAVEMHLKSLKEQPSSTKNTIPQNMGGCPGSRMMMMDAVEEEKNTPAVKSQLRQWPVQMHLVPPNAPYFKNSDLLITADCVPVAYGNYHQDLLKGKSVVMGCPKLDDVSAYIEKFVDMIQSNDFNSITIAFMEVPCCMGMIRALEQAMDIAGKSVPVHRMKITIDGQMVEM
ncbi:4Fe-4S binding protein [Irregularibacter muris]|uniref:4Fe-4S binding protein n=1 Tax=Irregularibacter muris TaxID=1796619 RepID=A0AAE3L2L2_9FIRM|nr:4Fe-4S binding protein [Irregularibacter muris]MCR1898784.1 4Fe-4S binding protein [Irregularibacter muris]